MEAGLFALPFAERYGGLGGNVLDLAIVSEEIGRYSGDLVTAWGGAHRNPRLDRPEHSVAIGT